MIRPGTVVRELRGTRRRGVVVRILAPRDRGQGEHRRAEIEVAWETAATVGAFVSPTDVEVIHGPGA